MRKEENGIMGPFYIRQCVLWHSYLKVVFRPSSFIRSSFRRCILCCWQQKAGGQRLRHDKNINTALRRLICYCFNVQNIKVLVVSMCFKAPQSFNVGKHEETHQFALNVPNLNRFQTIAVPRTANANTDEKAEGLNAAQEPVYIAIALKGISTLLHALKKRQACKIVEKLFSATTMQTGSKRLYNAAIVLFCLKRHFSTS